MTITMLAADTLARTSTTEAVAFWILGAIAVAGAIGVVAAPKAVYSAMFLAATMIAAGAVPGDRCALLMRNSAAYGEALVATGAAAAAALSGR